MNAKTFKNLRLTLIILIGAIVALSVFWGNVCAVLLAVGIGMLIIFILQRRVKGIVRDERTDTIGNKASRLTVAVIGIGMPITGAVLVAIGWNDPASALRQTGDGLLYATCALLVVNALAYTYYNRKS